MTNEDLQQRLSKLKKWENITCLMMLAYGLALLFVIPKILITYKDSGTVEQVVIGALFFIGTIGPIVWFAFAGLKYREKLGLRCPHCGRLYNRITADYTISQRHCRYCGKAIEA